LQLHRIVSFKAFCLSLLLLSGIQFSAFAQKIRIGIFYYHNVSGLLFSVNSGQYELWANSQKLDDLSYDAVISVKADDGKLQVKGLNKDYGQFTNVQLKESTGSGTFRVKISGCETRTYDNDLKILPRGEFLRIINEVEMSNYVVGVVEMETNSSANIEYYKIQAVMCRTFALGNLNKHAVQGFDLCDEVHCQAYKGKSRANPKILIATAATNNIVLADRQNELILAAYHANCGGETEDAADVWQCSKPYLRPVRDTFCLNQRSAKWEMEIDAKKWRNYLHLKTGVRLNADEPFCFYQKDRAANLPVDSMEIPLKQIRKDWRLRSTFFDMEEQADGKILIEGRGYGHGVGLCQQGALRMTELGYTYRQVLSHYYKGVRLVNYDSISKPEEAMR